MTPAAVTERTASKPDRRQTGSKAASRSVVPHTRKHTQTHADTQHTPQALSTDMLFPWPQISSCQPLVESRSLSAGSISLPAAFIRHTRGAAGTCVFHHALFSVCFLICCSLVSLQGTDKAAECAADRNLNLPRSNNYDTKAIGEPSIACVADELLVAKPCPICHCR